MTEQYLKELVDGICKVAEEYNAAASSEGTEREDTYTVSEEFRSRVKHEPPAFGDSELKFDYTTCSVCNGYYGPCFEDPLCATCHVFLYPNVIPSIEVPSLILESNSDSDSGNDEPVDGVFRVNGQENADDIQQRSGMNRLSINLGNYSPPQVPLEAAMSSTMCPSVSTNYKSSSPPSIPLASAQITVNNLYHSLFRDALPARLAPVLVDNLALQLQRLSVPAHQIDDFNIELFPPEVLIHTFQYLDEISLWSIGQVCSRWRSVLFMYVKPLRWKEFTLARWPLLPVQSHEQDWYELYTAMMVSSCCFKCVKQMSAQELPPNWDDNSWRKHRLRTELRVMRTDPLDGIEAMPLDQACCHWQATLEGPAGSAYEGGLFFLYIQVPVSYPLQPPIVRFLTKIFHPNISRHGDIGIDSIHQNWSLALTMSKLLISIQSLLTDPFCDVCMEPEVCQLYMLNRRAFEEQARSWTVRFAMHDMYKH